MTLVVLKLDADAVKKIKIIIDVLALTSPIGKLAIWQITNNPHTHNQ